MTPTRLSVADGMCATSVDADAVAAGLARMHAGDRMARVGCDGMCWAQPVVTATWADGLVRRYERFLPEEDWTIFDRDPSPGADAPITFDGQERRILTRCGVVDPASLADAERTGAYQGLKRARLLSAEEVVALVKAANLRGRGGAYFPIALKWESVRRHDGPRYLVVNAEEGEPGVYKDRHLMEGDPHQLVEGIAIAAYAADCERAFLYINGQAQLSAERLGRAIAEAHLGDYLGRELPIEIYRGAGGYVCGEESVILNSIEGERAVPRPRPPLPTDAGLWGRPTVINNVETLCNLPFILTEGVEAFRSVGTDAYPGTKLISLSGAIQRPGLYEVPMGTTTGEIIALGGGPPSGRAVRAVVLGGPSGGFLTPDLFDVPLVGGLAHPSGATLGAGGIVVLDDQTPLSAVLRHLAGYNARESCGKCTPCREGTERALAILDRAGTIGRLTAADRAALEELCDLMQYASLCGLGQMAPGPIRSALALFAGDADAIPDAQGERRW